MNSEHGQGLGVSVAIYMVAVICGLALFVVPVLLVNGPQQYVNRGMAAYEPPPGTLLIPKPARYSSSLALLKQDDPIDAAFVAALNAKVKKAEKPPRFASRTEPQVRSNTEPQVRSKLSPANIRYEQSGNSGRYIFKVF